MKKIALMVITSCLLTELYPWQVVLIDILLISAGKILCRDFELYFKENEAKTSLMKMLHNYSCKLCP